MTSTLSNYGWLGPATSVDPTGVVTNYTYTPFGTVATASSEGIVTTYTYDLAGNVVHVHTAGNYGNQPTLTTDTYAAYDAQGRQISSTDALGNITTTAYVDGSDGTTETVTYDDGTTMVEQFYLDGTPQSVSGTAVTPSSYDEGVDSNGNTWSQTLPNDGQDWTKTFTNTLGEQYKVQETGPGGAVETATTVFDDNGRPIQYTDFDGVSTYTIYNPATGAVAATWQDLARRRRSRPSAARPSRLRELGSGTRVTTTS